MHFLVHELDVWSIYSSMGWTQTKHPLVVLSMETKIFTSSFTWTIMPLLFGELIDVTSPRLENFLVHGLFSLFYRLI